KQTDVLETFYRDDMSAKPRPPSNIREQRFHDDAIFQIDVTKLGSIVYHRLNDQLLREFLEYSAKYTDGKINNC
ncbi:hypothetical protein AF381_24550, partial [Salmonella enterica subsp. enterica serovar Typhimurium]